MNHTPLVPTGATTDYLISSLVSLDPPLPVYLFHMVAGLRDKSAKGYPLKKVRTPLFCLRSFLSLRFFLPPGATVIVEDYSGLLRWFKGSYTCQEACA